MLAVATTLEQMSHLVCVISVVEVTSWSLSNALVSWLMAPADAEVCVCVHSMCVQKRLQFPLNLHVYDYVHLCLLICTHTSWFTQLSRTA